MHTNRRKQYDRLFPSINLQKQELSDEDLIIISKYYDPHLRVDVCSIREKILQFPRNYPKPSIIKQLIKEKITNPDGKTGGSKRTTLFWERRGYTFSEASEIVSNIQKENSPRSTNYWIKRGYSESESIQKVSEIQTENAKKMHDVLKQNDATVSVWSKRFWTDRGYTIEEAAHVISQYQRENVTRLWEKYDETQRRNFNILCIESWTKKGRDIEDYVDFRRVIRSSRTRSAIADEFCTSLQSHFNGNKIYCKETEFGKYIPDYRYVRYDYVDLDERVVVEFNGEYWHASEDARENDKRKKEFATKTMGFRYFVVTDKEYCKDKKSCIDKLVSQIKEKQHNDNSSQIN